jgi:hypothetical protein
MRRASMRAMMSTVLAISACQPVSAKHSFSILSYNLVGADLHLHVFCAS